VNYQDGGGAIADRLSLDLRTLQTSVVAHAVTPRASGRLSLISVTRPSTVPISKVELFRERRIQPCASSLAQLLYGGCSDSGVLVGNISHRHCFLEENIPINL